MNSRSPIILCVDDEPINLKLLGVVLKSQGYQVVTAVDGADALRKMCEHSIDLVLLDVMMPGMDGFETCKMIKNSEATQDIPVVMLTALSSSDDRIKGIEAGAEDFLTKPFHKTEVLARVKMLLKVKELGDRLRSSYNSLAHLTNFGEKMIDDFDPIDFDFVANVDRIVDQIISHSARESGKPAVVIAQFVDNHGNKRWLKYEYLAGQLLKFNINKGLLTGAGSGPDGSKKVGYVNSPDGAGDTESSTFMREFRSLGIKVKNMLWYLGNSISIFALNYGRAITEYECTVIKNLLMQSSFMRSLSTQVRETESGFSYVVFSLARAAEANDEDTGNHILRVGEYSAILAQTLGMSGTFVDKIRLEAPLHDVGKIHVHPDIINKPGKFTDEEFVIMKTHPVAGASIIGEHKRLRLAKNIALAHHERWDGSGYPSGLKGEEIPLEARIATVADQYDALRNARSYKPAFDHNTAYRILAEGDGRTMPHHFDPQVLTAFIRTASRFDETYERLSG